MEKEILFLDEATSAYIIKQKKSEAIHSLNDKNLKMIIIAHRKTNLIFGDRIIDVSTLINVNHEVES